jgi:hypothetical protein
MGEDEQGHLLSLYGGDAEVGAIIAAIYEKHSFTLRFPDGKSREIRMGEDASCYRGTVTVPGRRQSLRHLVAISLALHNNGAAGKTYLLNYDRTQRWSVFLVCLQIHAGANGSRTGSGETRESRSCRALVASQLR